jgi:HEAT repeat protein
MVDTTEFNPHSQSMRHKAMHALAVLKDERGIIPIVGRLRVIFDRDAAIKATRELGPIAEPIVLNLLSNDKDSGVQAECCRLLKDIGTKQSTQLLGILRGHRDNNVRAAAAEALQAIQARK